MGVSLAGRAGDLSLNWYWRRRLAVAAVEFGWRPAGTVLDDYMVAQQMGLSHDPETWDEMNARRIRRLVDQVGRLLHVEWRPVRRR